MNDLTKNEVKKNTLKSAGIYSVKKGKWLKVPVLKDIPEIDQEKFDKEFIEWENKYFDTIEEPTIEKIDKFLDDIYYLRKTSIADGGEYAIGNLVFKECRNLGYLDYLRELKNELKSKELSLSLEEELELQDIKKFSINTKIELKPNNAYMIRRDGYVASLEESAFSIIHPYLEHNGEIGELYNLVEFFRGYEPLQKYCDVCENFIDKYFGGWDNINEPSTVISPDSMLSWVFKGRQVDDEGNFDTEFLTDRGFTLDYTNAKFSEKEFLKDLSEYSEAYNALTSNYEEHLCRFRIGDKYYGVSQKEKGDYDYKYPIYFRLTSKHFNWFDYIWTICYLNRFMLTTITCENETTGKVSSWKGEPINPMEINDFLNLEGNPVIEKLKAKHFNKLSRLTESEAGDFIIEDGVLVKYRGKDKEVIIPDNVTSIGNCAFKGCLSLKNIVIPDSVTSISSWAFYSCSNLTDITIPNSITSISSWTFEDCSSLASITIPDSVTNIGYEAFHNCSNLKNIVIPDSVESIDDAAFSGCSQLTSITIPNSVIGIGERVFKGCSDLNVFTDNVKVISNLLDDDETNVNIVTTTPREDMDVDIDDIPVEENLNNLNEGLSKEEVLNEIDNLFGQEEPYLWSTYILPNGHFLNPHNPNADKYWEEVGEPDEEHSDFIFYEYNPFGESTFDDCVKMNVTVPYLVLPTHPTEKQYKAIAEVCKYDSFTYDSDDSTFSIWVNQEVNTSNMRYPLIVSTECGTTIFDLALYSGEDIVKAVKEAISRNVDINTINIFNGIVGFDASLYESVVYRGVGKESKIPTYLRPYYGTYYSGDKGYASLYGDVKKYNLSKDLKLYETRTSGDAINELHLEDYNCKNLGAFTSKYIYESSKDENSNFFSWFNDNAESIFNTVGQWYHKYEEVFGEDYDEDDELSSFTEWCQAIVLKDYLSKNGYDGVHYTEEDGADQYQIWNFKGNNVSEDVCQVVDKSLKEVKKTLYHNTESNFDKFDKYYIGSGFGGWVDGFFFAEEPIKEYGKTLTCEVTLDNPYRLDWSNDEDVLKFFKDIDLEEEYIEYFNQAKDTVDRDWSITKALKESEVDVAMTMDALGYDGMIVDNKPVGMNTKKKITEYIVFDENKVNILNKDKSLKEVKKEKITHKDYRIIDDETIIFAKDLPFKDVKEKFNIDDIPEIVYHSTTVETAKKILTDGELKQGNKNWEASAEGKVYFTSSRDDALEYAGRGCDFKEDLVVFEIKTENLDLDKVCIDHNEEYFKIDDVWDIFNYTYSESIPLEYCTEESIQNIKNDIESAVEETAKSEFATKGIFEGLRQIEEDDDNCYITDSIYDIKNDILKNASLSYDNKYIIDDLFDRYISIDPYIYTHDTAFDLAIDNYWYPELCWSNEDKEGKMKYDEYTEKYVFSKNNKVWWIYMMPLNGNETSEYLGQEFFKYEYIYDTFSILTRQPFEECSLYKVLGEPKKVIKQSIKEDYDKEGKYGHTLPDGTKYSIWNDYDGWNNSLIAYKGEDWMDNNDKIIRDNILGIIEFQVNEDKKLVYINLIQTKYDMKRKGIATTMYNSLKSLYPNYKIDWGLMTDDGQALYNKIAGKEAKGVSIKKALGENIKRSSLNDSEIINILSQTNENLTESKEDIAKFRQWAGDELADEFYKYKDRMKGEEKDIYYWIKQGDWGKKELSDYVDRLKKTPTRAEVNQKGREGAELIYEDDTWRVYHITSYEGAVKYGKGTQWCITGNNDGGLIGREYWDGYKEGGSEFYFYINKKTNDKWALDYSPNHWTVYDDGDFVEVGNWMDYKNTDDCWNPYDASKRNFPNIEGLPDLNAEYDRAEREIKSLIDEGYYDYDKKTYVTPEIVNDELIDTTYTTMSHYNHCLPSDEDHQYMADYKDAYGMIVSMSPEKYYKECAKIFRTSVDDLKQQRSEDTETISKLKEIIKHNQFPICIIDYSENSQEGLHRMMAIGEVYGWSREVPVLIVVNSDKVELYKSIYDGKILSEKLLGKNKTLTEGTNNFRGNSVFPSYRVHSFDRDFVEEEFIKKICNKYLKENNLDSYNFDDNFEILSLIYDSDIIDYSDLWGTGFEDDFEDYIADNYPGEVFDDEVEAVSNDALWKLKELFTRKDSDLAKFKPDDTEDTYGFELEGMTFEEFASEIKVEPGYYEGAEIIFPLDSKEQLIQNFVDVYGPASISMIRDVLEEFEKRCPAFTKESDGELEKLLLSYSDVDVNIDNLALED